MSEPATSDALPQRRRTYQHHHLDSTRWDRVTLRPGDIVISTAYKAGTTWMQTIAANLIFGGSDWPAHLHDMSPWIDLRVRPIESVVESIEAQHHRRFFKTHLPLDGIPYDPEVRYVVVARDARDVFVSWRNHYGAYTDGAYAVFNDTPGRVGDPLPRMEADVHRAWRDWLTRGWFPWERDGYPFWSFFHHLQTWWDFGHLTNLHFVHYADLLTDLEAEMRDVASFLDICVPEERWPRLVENATFATMKRDAEKYAPARGQLFVGGAKTFIHQGTNERWRGVLDATDLALYDRVVPDRLSPDCARWLALGRKGVY